ncbi:MAG: ABC transporter ATP-binding protein [candidate division WOR-3 bacterium]
MWHDDFALDEEETRFTGRASTYLARLWPFFARYLGRVIASAILLIASTGLGLLGPVLLKRAIDVNIGQGDLRGLALTSITYLVVQAVMFLASYFQMVWLAQVGERGAADLKQTLFRHLLDLPMAFFDRMPSGKLVSRVESDTEALKMLFTRTSVVLLQSFLLLVGMSAIMAITSWRLYLLVLVLLPPFVLAFWLFQKRVRPLYLEVRRIVADTNNLVSEALKGLPVIQVFCQEPRFAARMEELNRQKFRAEVRAFGLWSLVWFLVDFGEIVGIGLVLGVGGVWALGGTLTIGTLFMFISYITRLFGPLRQISDQLNVMQRAFAAAERAFAILDQAPEPSVPKEQGPEHLSRAITLENLSFSYDGASFVLKDVNLVIRKGEKVALVGETGGGKTSIVNLLMKFYLCQQGRVLYDGTDIKGLDRHRLRQMIGFVPQEVVMFPGTVLDNLRMFDETIPTERVMAAARRVRIHETISRFPKGYETVLSEGGANFSLGERQLLAFARALVRDPEILILDEATSSVDPHTERLIQEGLKELLSGRTAIIIAHRLATVQLADRVVVVHKGRVAEEGTHAELVARDGIYSRLYRLQFVTQEAQA